MNLDLRERGVSRQDRGQNVAIALELRPVHPPVFPHLARAEAEDARERQGRDQARDEGRPQPLPPPPPVTRRPPLAVEFPTVSLVLVHAREYAGAGQRGQAASCIRTD